MKDDAKMMDGELEKTGTAVEAEDGRKNREITHIELPEGVTSVDGELFAEYDNLESIKIPASATEMALSAFDGCTSLKRIEFAGTTFRFENGAIVTWLGSLERWLPSFGGTAIVPDSVKEIGIAAFRCCTALESIVLPEGVEKIEAAAFEGCTSLKSVVLPGSVKEIGDRAFEGCTSLASVVLPEGLTVIPPQLFDGCTSLEFVRIPSSVTEIAQDAFDACSALRRVECTGTAFRFENGVLLGDNGKTLLRWLPALAGTSASVPEGVEEIGSRAFDGCISLTAVVLPKSLKKIGVAAFADCTSLESIRIPSGVTEIDGSAFNGCSSLRNIDCDGTAFRFENGALLADNGKTLLRWFPAFAGTSCAIPEGVERIEALAFRHCTALESLVVPGSVEKIGMYSFWDCGNLKSVVLAEGVKEIGEGAFHGCASLESIRIPSSVARIVVDAFDGCVSLQSMDCTGTAFRYENGVLLADGGKTLFRWIPDFTGRSVAIPAGVEKIGDFAFQDCTALESVVLPGGVTEIGEGAFLHCFSLASIVIPEGVKKIGAVAFRCAGLKEVELPRSVEVVGAQAFTLCENLVTVRVPARLELTTASQFQGCHSLKAILKY